MIFMGKIISMVVKKWRPDNRYWLAIGSAVELVGRAAFSRERMLLSRGGGHFSKGEDGAVIVEYPEQTAQAGRNAMEKPGAAGGLESPCQPAGPCESNSDVELGSKSGTTPLTRLVGAWICMM